MYGRSALLRVLATVIVASGIAVVASAQDSTSTATPIANRDTSRHIEGLRSPGTAAVLGTVIPGAGLLYARQWARAAGTYFGAISGIGLRALMMTADRCTFTFLSGKSCDPGPVWPQRTLGIVAIGSGVALWAYGAVDAARIVRRDNAEKLEGRRAGVIDAQPTIFAPGARGDPWSLGVHAKW